MKATLERLRTYVEERRVFASSRSRRRFVMHAVAGAATMAILAILLRHHIAVLTDPMELRSTIRGFGIWAPIVLVLLQTLQVVLAPIPGQVLAVVAGYLFGPWWGTAFNMIGITIGSAIAFWLSRRFGRAYVETIVHDEMIEAFDEIDTSYTLSALFLFFLIPGLPDDVLCFVGGLTDIRLWKLVAIAIVGRTPAFFLVNVVGDFVGTGRFGAAATLVAILLTVSLLGYLHRDRLVRFFDTRS